MNRVSTGTVACCRCNTELSWPERVADPRSGPRLCEAQRFMVPMRAQKRKEAFHEPYPLIPSFSPSGGEGARRAVEGDSDRFMASIQVRILEVSSAHEPLRYGS